MMVNHEMVKDAELVVRLVGESTGQWLNGRTWKWLGLRWSGTRTVGSWSGEIEVVWVLGSTGLSNWRLCAIWVLRIRLGWVSFGWLDWALEWWWRWTAGSLVIQVGDGAAGDEVDGEDGDGRRCVGW
uniref:Uncharacterized protein n=1 Tax=Cannabis sativa TaxID=3483 RepID=A0A803Q716_CANSA